MEAAVATGFAVLFIGIVLGYQINGICHDRYWKRRADLWESQAEFWRQNSEIDNALTTRLLESNHLQHEAVVRTREILNRDY